MIGIILVEVSFSWGHIIKPPYQGLGGSPIPYPPPTTLVGALAYPYTHYIEPVEITMINGKPFSPAVKLLDKVLYAVAGYLEPRVTTLVDMNRYFTYAYIRSRYRRDQKYWTAVMGVGKTFTPTKGVIAYIVDSKNLEVLSKISWGLIRVGSKEGLIAVNKVSIIKDPEEIDDEYIETIFPTPANIVSVPESGASKITLIKLSKDAYTWTKKDVRNLVEEYYVPEKAPGIYGGKMGIRVAKDKAIIYNTPYSPLPVPKITKGG